jgi:hypothetical protein
MPSVLAWVALFAGGMYLAIRLVAALYSPIDLWYAIRTAWPTVATRVLGWAGVTVIVLLLLEGPGQRWLVAGMLSYVTIYLAVCLGLLLAGAMKPKPPPVVE